LKKLPRPVTLRDPNLPHQVVFFYGEGGVHVSCNCLCVGDEEYISMGKPDGDLAMSRWLYNNRANHRKSFEREDFAKW